MRITAEQQRVSIAQAEIAVELEQLQQKHQLTSLQMLSAVTVWQARKVRNMADPERVDG